MNIGTLTVTLGADMAQLTTGLSKANSALQRFGFVASAALTAPMVAAGKASFDMAKEYEYAIQTIVGLTGTAQGVVDGLNKSILKMAPELARNPLELAQGAYFIMSSGIKDASKAMDVLTVSAKAATSGLGETQAVANVLTSALNAYAGTGLTAAYAADVLVAAVREGKAEASGFATAIGQIIPIGAQLGVSFDQVAGGMAAITLTGASASNAAVYLKGIFNSLLTASKQGETALNAMNSSYAELRDILAKRGLIALMQTLRDMQMKYGDEMVSEVLPNIRALTGFLSLAGKNFKYNSELMERVTNSAGSLGQAFAAVSDTIKVRYDSAISKARVSIISLGTDVARALIPILETLVNKLEQITSWFNSLTDSQKKNRLMILAATAALGPLSLILSSLIWIVRGLASAFGLLRTAMTFLLANPYAAAAAAVLSAVLALKNYASHVKEVARAHDSFNTAVVRVNGNLQKLKELSSADYSTMTLNELQRAQITVQQEWQKAYNLYQQGVTNQKGYNWLERFFGADKNNYKFMQEQISKIDQLKGQYDELGEAIYNAWKKGATEKEVQRLEQLMANLKRVREEMAAINKWYLDRYQQSLERTNQRMENPTPYVAMPDFQKLFMRTSNFTAGQPTYEQTLEYMKRAKVLASELTQIFESVFSSIGKGWNTLMQEMIQALNRLIAAFAARAVVYAILSLLSGGSSNLAIGAKELIKGGFGKFMFTSLGRGMASGGTVPEGYPNDSYFARLSSGETVLPKGFNFNSIGLPRYEEKLVTELSGDHLYVILQRKMRRSNSFR